jgi:hypothetical protein
MMRRSSVGGRIDPSSGQRFGEISRHRGVAHGVPCRGLKTAPEDMTVVREIDVRLRGALDLFDTQLNAPPSPQGACCRDYA